MSEFALRREAAAWLDAGIDAVEVCVIESRGSVPRGDGTRMLVAADRVAGTIGGGHLELKAIEQAREVLAAFTRWRATAAGGSAPFESRVERFPLGPALGQCCGGVVSLQYRALTAEVLARWPQPKPLFHLQLYGAGHVGRAIVRLLRDIDCTVQWIDEREGEFPPLDASSPSDGPQIERVCVEPVEAEVRDAPRGAFYLVLTHSHDLDLRITEAILKRGDFGFCGLIGSATKRARFLRRFEDRGIAPDVLARLTCPIGVPGIAGKEPAVIAVAVVAQLLQAAAR